MNRNDLVVGTVSYILYEYVFEVHISYCIDALFRRTGNIIIKYDKTN